MPRQRVLEMGETQHTGPPAITLSTKAHTYLQELAELVRAAYCDCYQQLTGRQAYGERRIAGDAGEDAYGRRKTEPDWVKIARRIIACDAPPLAYVKAQFVGAVPSRPPRANQLYGESALARWEAFRYQSRETLQRKIESDYNQLRVRVLPLTKNMGWEYRRALNYVLKDRSCPVSPMIRYCAAIGELLPVADQLRGMALKQYLFQMDDFDALLGELVPEDFRAEATALKSLMAR